MTYSNPVMFLPISLLLLLMVSVTITSVHVECAAIYHFIDPHGVVHLSDRKPANQKAVRVIYLESHYSPRPAVSQATKEMVINELQAASVRHNLDLALLKAIAKAESGFNPNAISSQNAQGVMQLIPSTASRFGVSDPFDYTQNIDGACKYLTFLMNMFNSDIPKVVAAYNAGENNVVKYDGIPPFSETIYYLSAVLKYYHSFGGPKIEPPVASTKQVESSSPPSRRRIKKWVDDDGIVHLSNR